MLSFWCSRNIWNSKITAPLCVHCSVTLMVVITGMIHKYVTYIYVVIINLCQYIQLSGNIMPLGETL